jgi:hypothetical protein
MKDRKDEDGNILDKEFVYESKGFGYVLFKDTKEASAVIIKNIIFLKYNKGN